MFSQLTEEEKHTKYKKFDHREINHFMRDQQFNYYMIDSLSVSMRIIEFVRLPFVSAATITLTDERKEQSSRLLFCGRHHPVSNCLPFFHTWVFVSLYLLESEVTLIWSAHTYCGGLDDISNLNYIVTFVTHIQTRQIVWDVLAIL
jgi:hypothetical protein